MFKKVTIRDGTKILINMNHFISISKIQYTVSSDSAHCNTRLVPIVEPSETLLVVEKLEYFE